MSMGGLPQQKWLQAALYAGLLLLFAVAVAVGMTTPMPEDELALEQARIYIGNYLETLPAARISGFKETLSDVLLNGLLLLLLALGGTHILGAPLILTVLFIKGMSVGYGAAFLLLYPGLSGGGLILLATLPPNLLLLPALLRGSAVALGLSTALLRRRHLPGFAWYRYLLIYAKLMLIIVAAALLHGYLTPWLLRLAFIAT